jgi:DNA end-binding protein Ku
MGTEGAHAALVLNERAHTLWFVAQRGAVMAAGAASAGARALWKGYIRLGLVTVPVKLYTAVRPQGVSFNMLHDQDQGRIQFRLVDPTTGEEVNREHIVKGFELHKDEYVIVDEEEIDKLVPPSSRDIAIEDFVEEGSIDPIYCERAYFLGPDVGGEKSYPLLAKALKKTRKVGICKFVMRKREYLAQLRTTGPKDEYLMLETLRWADEVLPRDEVAADESKLKVSAAEEKMALQLVESLAVDKFDPGQFKDEFTEKVLDLVNRKARGEKVELPEPEEPEPTGDIDLSEVLKASIAHTQQRRGTSGRARITNPSSRAPRRKRSA